MTCPANPVPSVESGSPTTQPLPGLVPVDYLTPLIAALSAQTEAMNRLAQSNEMLVRAMAEGEDIDDVPPAAYLDGRPIR